MKHYEFFFSDHAIHRFHQRFHSAHLSLELKSVAPCKAKDLHFISGTVSYKRIKKSDRHKYRFLVSDCKAYFICKTMGVFGGVEHLKVITVLKDENGDFQQVMMDYALESYIKKQELEQESLSTNKVNSEEITSNLDQEQVIKEVKATESKGVGAKKAKKIGYPQALGFLIKQPRFSSFIKSTEEIDQNCKISTKPIVMLASVYQSYLNLKGRIEDVEIDSDGFNRLKKRELNAIAQKIEKLFLIKEKLVKQSIGSACYVLVDELVVDYLNIALKILDTAKKTETMSAKDRDSVISIFSAIIKAEGVSFKSNDSLKSIFSYLIAYEQCEMTKIYETQSFTAKELSDKIFKLSYLSKMSFIDDELKMKVHDITSFYDVILDRVMDLGIDDMLEITVASLNQPSVPNCSVAHS